MPIDIKMEISDRQMVEMGLLLLLIKSVLVAGVIHSLPEKVFHTILFLKTFKKTLTFMG